MLFKTVGQIDADLAKRVRHLRKKKKLTQKQLSDKCNIAYSTYQRFEQTGHISLFNLTKVAVALGLDQQIDDLFKTTAYHDIQEVIDGYKAR